LPAFGLDVGHAVREVLGLFGVPDVGLGTMLLFGLVSGLVLRPFSILVIWVFFGLFFGLSTDEIETKAMPNQGIHHSARIALVVGLVYGMVVGLLFGLLGLVVGLVFGLLSGLLVGLAYGGQAVLKHSTLRWLLSHNGSLPLRLVPSSTSAPTASCCTKSAAGTCFSTGCSWITS